MVVGAEQGLSRGVPESLLMVDLFLFLLNLNSGYMLPGAVEYVGGESKHPDAPHPPYWAVELRVTTASESFVNSNLGPGAW